VPDLWVNLMAMLVYGPLLILLHELGHALFARAGGYRVTSFGVGLGPPLWSVYLKRGVVFHIDRWIFAGGACTAIPVGPPSMRRAWFHGGGLIVQALLAGILLWLPSHWLISGIFWFNLLVALHNALPWRIGGQASDGWYLLDAFTGGRRGGSILTQRSSFERIERHEERIGSPVGRVYSQICLAWTDVLAGRPEDATPLFLNDPPESLVDPWIDGLYHYVQAEWHRTQGRALAALRIAREAHSAIDFATHDEAAILMSLAEARALVDLEANAQARRRLAQAAGIGGPIGWQAAATLLWASIDGETDDLEQATWRVTRRRHEAWLDPGDATLALWHAAQQLEERGRVTAARGARDAASTLARRTLRDAADVDRVSLSRRLRVILNAQTKSAIAGLLD
jgi:hypothetical protein